MTPSPPTSPPPLPPPLRLIFLAFSPFEQTFFREVGSRRSKEPRNRREKGGGPLTSTPRRQKVGGGRVRWNNNRAENAKRLSSHFESMTFARTKGEVKSGGTEMAFLGGMEKSRKCQIDFMVNVALSLLPASVNARRG